MRPGFLLLAIESRIVVDSACCLTVCVTLRMQ